MCYACRKQCCASNKIEACGCDTCPNPNCWSADFYWQWEKDGSPDPKLYVAQQRGLFDELSGSGPEVQGVP